ncbi:MAG: BamA/TamA family outer membrane protein [Gemmatimonadales bacterium]
MTLRLVLAAAALSLLPVAPARGQAPRDSGRRVTITAGAHYRAGWLHRLLLGDHHRDLWTTPIEVDVLDLSRFAGGLTPERCGGGRQTKSLRLLAADGREFVFRSVDKDPQFTLHPELRETFARAILQDQISSAHPGGPLVVAPLLGAAGVLHVQPRMVTLPDDPRLAGFDCVSAGMLGMIEERPTEPPDDEPGFAGAADVEGTEELFDRLEDDADHRVHARALLTARLIDVFIGDWDRHQDQWRWARFDSAGGHWWRPIPRDRDQAFSRLDGLLVWIAGFYQPQLVSFEDDYPSVWRLTYSGRVVDRRLLTGLDRATWDSVARALQGRLTDSVIAAAVRALPPPYFARSGEDLRRALQRRRDRLPQIAARYYELLAETVDVHATDQRDVAEAVRHGAGLLTLRLAHDGRRYYQRTFRQYETSEIRLYLHGNDDRLLVRDSLAGAGGPLLRVIGGGGDDELTDSSRTATTRLYDDEGRNRFVPGPRTSVDSSHYRVPPADSVSLERPRDWGSRSLPLVWTSYAPDVGLFIGGGLTRTGYGFRRFPYRWRVQVRAGYATTAQTYRAEFTGEFRGVVAPAVLSLRARASGIEILHFYGFGNETPDTGGTDFYKVRQQQYTAAPALQFTVAGPLQLSIGPVLKFARTRIDAGSFIATARPYGVDEFAQVGVTADMQLDTRDLRAAATRGLAVNVGGSVYPKALDVASAFGEIHAEASAHFTAPIPSTPTLALRIGGRKVWGTFPMHEAAYLGGWSTVRGFPEQRFAGHAAVFGNVELRLAVTPFFVILPGELGVFALADAGRVYAAGEQSERWHAGAGGGLWVAFLKRANTVSLAAADGGDGVRLYARAGFAF